jgi:U3 small nucleolar RNA-associated protein 18
MARTKGKKDSRQNGVKAKAAAPGKKSAPAQDDSASDMSDVEQYDAPAGQDDMDMSEDDKDAAEEELERAVFGDSMGFRAGLAGFETGLDDEDSADEGAAASGDDQVYDGLADSDLFFTDVGASTELKPVPATEEEEEDEGAAWQDSDDERMVVSLASVPRLRKLRRTEAEDVISGKDYVRRLRKQYVDSQSITCTDNLANRP